MNLSFFIAKRYLFSKKTRNLINWISGISVFGVSVFTMAMIVILSVFNGLDSVVKSLFSSFDPDFKISAAEGKVFSSEDSLIRQIDKLNEIAFYTKVLEENALLEYDERQAIGKVKGVSGNFGQTSGIDSMVISGEFLLENEYEKFAVLGWGLSNTLSINLNLLRPIKIWVPKRNAKPGIMVNNAFNIKPIFPIGIFSVLQDDYDAQLMIVPLEFAQNLLEYTDELSSIEIKASENVDLDILQKKIEDLLGDAYIVKNRFQQHEFLFKVMQSEKWAIFLIFSFILIIASFNLTGSLTMLIIDKKKDIVTLKNMGAENSLVKKIFLIEGWLIAFIGAILGLILGAVVCWAQKEFGIVELPQAFVVRYYPVEMRMTDFLSVFFIVLAIGFISSWVPVRFITKKHLKI
ncbi:MAG: FtsX-like permease family protein [Bacteroidota bacterium]